MIARRLSGLERVWLAADRISSPFAIHQIVEWPGPLDVDRWRDAIQRAAGPGMRLRLRGILGGARWVVSDAPVPVDVIETPWDGAGPTPWLERPLPPKTGPVRVRLVPGDPARVVFSAHHAVTDGRGLWRFVTDAARALAGETIEPPLAGPLTDAELARGLGVEPLEPIPSDAVPPCPAPPGHPPTWRRRRLPAGPEVLPRLAAAFAAAARPPPEAQGVLRFGVPVDLRRYAPEARDSTANLSGIAHLEVPPDVTPAAVRALLDRAVADKVAARHPLAAEAIRKLPVWLIAAVGHGANTREARAQRFGTTLALSYLGRHTLAIDGHPARVAFTLAGSIGLPLFVGITTDAAGVEIVASGALAPEAIDGLLDRMTARYTGSMDAKTMP